MYGSDSPQAAFDRAVIEGDVVTARQLLASGKVISIEAIFDAARKGHVEIVRLMLADARVRHPDYYYYLIIEAARHGHVEIVRLLLP
jgi:hypothetical protein